MSRDRILLFAQRAAAYLYPRRCPFCREVLRSDKSQVILCPSCAVRARTLAHNPPRLPLSEHVFYAVHGAASAYYYEDEVRQAILLCKLHGNPWLAREMTDLTAICLFGARPAGQAGGCPDYEAPGGLRPYDCIVPVPPRQGSRSGPRLPELMARRLGQILHLPVCRDLRAVKPMLPQKSLSLRERLLNQRDGYALRSGSSVIGRRILLVDDVITSGATVSACALALFQGGAADVFAASIAVDEEH